MPMRLLFAPVLGLAVAGCATVGELSEPKEIPALVQSYRIKELEAQTGNVGTMLDLDDCTELAVLASVGLSGVPSVAGHFPVRSLVEREFQKVVAGNFRTVLPDEEPSLEIRIVSNRLAVKRSWSRVSAEMDFEVQLVDPQHKLRPYLRRKYHLTAESEQRNKRETPTCVYSCIQNLALRFIKDVSSDTHVIARLKALGAGK